MVRSCRLARARPGLWAWALSLASTLTLIGVGCGDEGKPTPGFAGPCDTPMAAVVGCPAAGAGSLAPLAAIDGACDRLVSCGILAAEYLVPAGGSREHRLDYRWCVDLLRQPPNDPCAGTRLDADVRDAAVACILTTPCTALGLPLSQKLKGSERDPLDRYSCNNDTAIWTATVCDHGLLRY